MCTAACQAKDRVARSDQFAIYDFILLHGSNCESRKIVFTGWIHARHFGGLPSNESTACLLAPGGNTLDYLRCSCDIKFSAGEVIQKEQRFGTLHQNIVYAHRDQVDADRIVPVQLECEFELGANAIGAGNQYGVAVFLRKFEKGANPADACQNALAMCAFGERLYIFDEFVPGIDIYASVTIR